MAAWELINGSLRDEPRRVGESLRPPFGGYWLARRSTYRIRYRIDDGTRTIVIMDVQHRANGYRT
jgi:mRNA interferase RelE/StbE